jgi:hypothetical protein
VSETRYWQLINRLVLAGQDDAQPKAQIREDIIAEVHASYAAGEVWAIETLMRWERDGADRDYTTVHKKLNSVTYITGDGRRVRKTMSYSRPTRSPESGKVVGQQMQTWWGMSRSALVDLQNSLVIQVDNLGVVVQALDQLIAAMDRHPECATAREAWEADGRSVNEIDLGEDIADSP